MERSIVNGVSAGSAREMDLFLVVFEGWNVDEHSHASRHFSHSLLPISSTIFTHRYYIRDPYVYVYVYVYWRLHKKRNCAAARAPMYRQLSLSLV